MIDWKALALKQVTPPFVPNVESDESTANFDPEFTSADLSEAGIDIFDDDDPSEEWVSQSMHESALHLPNGPLGSDVQQQQTSSSQSSRAIQITRPKKTNAPRGSPISHSVQQEFQGFSFMGESLVGAAAGRLAQCDEEEEECPETEPTTEDEYEDDRPAGRIARNRGKEGFII